MFWCVTDSYDLRTGKRYEIDLADPVECEHFATEDEALGWNERLLPHVRRFSVIGSRRARAPER